MTDVRPTVPTRGLSKPLVIALLLCAAALVAVFFFVRRPALDFSNTVADPAAGGARVTQPPGVVQTRRGLWVSVDGVAATVSLRGQGSVDFDFTGLIAAADRPVLQARQNLLRNPELRRRLGVTDEQTQKLRELEPPELPPMEVEARLIELARTFRDTSDEAAQSALRTQATAMLTQLPPELSRQWADDYARRAVAVREVLSPQQITLSAARR